MYFPQHTMKKHLLLIFLLILSSVKSQSQKTLYIFDSEDSRPISNAKIVTENSIFYTNDDGKALIPDHIKEMEISAPSYGIKKSDGNSLQISLKPIYKDIEEVAITNIDIKKLLWNVINNYQNIYYTKPSLYMGTIKQKSFIDNALAHLLVVDVNIWSKYNFFDISQSKDPDSFFQIGLNGVKYYKTKKFDDNFYFQSVPNLQPKDFVGTFFMNYHILGVLNTTKDLKIKTKILYENAGIQKIYFESEENTKEGVKFEGILTFNKNDNAIVNFKNNVIQKNYFSEKIDKNGVAYKAYTTNAELFFDFYKKNGKYYPSLITANGIGYSLKDGEKIAYNAYQEIKLEKFEEANKRGLKNKIDLFKSFIDNIPDKSVNETKTLLSNEEQNFIGTK